MSAAIPAGALERVGALERMTVGSEAALARRSCAAAAPARKYDRPREGRHPCGRERYAPAPPDADHEQAPAPDLRPPHGEPRGRGAQGRGPARADARHRGRARRRLRPRARQRPRVRDRAAHVRLPGPSRRHRGGARARRALRRRRPRARHARRQHLRAAAGPGCRELRPPGARREGHSVPRPRSGAPAPSGRRRARRGPDQPDHREAGRPARASTRSRASTCTTTQSGT